MDQPGMDQQGMDRVEDAAEEQVALVDESGEVIGSAPRSRVRGENLRHLGTAILLRSPAGQIYLHQRSPRKDWAPGLWDAAAGGLVAAGEDPHAGAVRELAEELGVSGVDLTPLGICRYDDDRVRVVDHLFQATWEGPVVWQPEEVVDGRWTDLEELGPLIESGAMVPDTASALEQLSDDAVGDYGQLRVFAGARALGLDFVVRRHGRVSSLAEAAAARGISPRQLLKTLVVRVRVGEYCMVLVPGDREIAWPRLRSLLGVNRLSLATAEQAREATGFVRGTITPLGSRTPLPLVVDASVEGPVSLGGGAHGVGVTVDSGELSRAFAASVADVTSPAD